MKTTIRVLSYTVINGQEYICWYISFPTVLLPQLNTHRAFSRNVSSTRAISHKRMRKRVLDDPYVPEITMNKLGMSGEPIESYKKTPAYWIYRVSRYPAVFAHWLMEKAGSHKQEANRLLTPWLYSDVILSVADDFALRNFFDLRTSEYTQPDFRHIAIWMRESITIPDVVNEYDVILPTYGVVPLDQLDAYTLFSVAGNLARVSYAKTNTSGYEPNEKDYQLGRRLYENKHLSPFEHIVVALGDGLKYHNRIGYVNIRQLITEEPFPVCGAAIDLRDKIMEVIL